MSLKNIAFAIAILSGLLVGLLALVFTSFTNAAFAASFTTAVVATLGAMFLAEELEKKFKFLRDFADDTDQRVVYSTRENPEPSRFKNGLWKIVLRSDTSFGALVMFKLKIPAGNIVYDHYGYIRSRKEDGVCIAVLEIYVDEWGLEQDTYGPTVFLITRPVLIVDGGRPVIATSTDADQALAASRVYPGHWYQRAFSSHFWRQVLSAK